MIEIHGIYCRFAEKLYCINQQKAGIHNKHMHTVIVVMTESKHSWRSLFKIQFKIYLFTVFSGKMWLSIICSWVARL